MTFVKRLSLTLSAFIVMFVGTLSFFPRSFAVSDIELPSLPLNSSNSSYFVVGVLTSSSSNPTVYLFEFDSRFNSSISITVNVSSSRFISTLSSGNGSPFTLYRSYYNLSSSSWVTMSSSTVGATVTRIVDFGPASGSSFIGRSNILFSGVSVSNSSSVSQTFSIDLASEPYLLPSFLSYSPFYFPEMPHGYFDGNINVVDGSYNIDFPSNSSLTGSISSQGMDRYTWTLDNDIYFYGDNVQGQFEGWIDNGSIQGSGTPGGVISQTAAANRNISLSLSDLDSVVNYSPAYNENSRFRCWSCVIDSSYVWFVSDTRNKITGSYVSKSSDEVTFKYVFSDPQGGNTLYPVWAIVFSPLGEVIQVLSPSSSSNSNTYTLSFSIGTLEQDSETSKWSVDPLYHGVWFSNDSPPVQGLTSLSVAENKKILANPVFGESAFQLSFLDSINSTLDSMKGTLEQIAPSINQGISNQTSQIQNMDAASNFDPTDVQNMLQYGSLESSFNAPSTDDLFSLSGGSFTDGMGFWRDRMNELLYYSGSPVLPMTIFSLTLGLAVLIIGRRVSGGGTA